MRALLRVGSLLALSILLAPAGFADEPPGEKTPAKKLAASKAVGADSEAAGTVAPSGQNPRGGNAAQETPKWRPMPATTGTLGFFTLETGETLPRKGFSFSTYVNKFSREPGSITVLNFGWNAAYGLSDRVSVYVDFDPHRFIHVSRPNRLSLRSSTFNPQFDSTIYRSLTAVPGTAPGYVEDYPFAAHNLGGVGEVTLGIKIALWSQARGRPVSLSVRNDFILPTRTSAADLLGNQTQSGQFNYQVGVAVSRNWRNLAVASVNGSYRFTRDPRFAGVRALTQADQFRIGAGFLMFPQKRVQLISEYSGLIFVGDHTLNTTFGVRDPVENVTGVRLYPLTNLAVDLGYRYMLNLTQHGDRTGFVVKIGTVYMPEKPKPVNHSPVAACFADKDSVFAGSDESVAVRVEASDPDGDPLTYSWTSTGGRVEGSGSQVRWNSAGLPPGTYTVTVRVEDGRGGTASCSRDIRVEPRPNRAPVLTCSVDRPSVLAGERVQVTGTGSDPDGDPLTYAWRTNGGQIIGSGATVQLDTSGLASGRYTVTGRVEDGRGGAADCSVDVNVQTPPPAPQASKLNECFFRLSRARVDNVCKRILDDVALRLQADPRARVMLVGYADPKERRSQKLASERAANAKKYLVSKGIAETRTDTRAAGGQVGAGKQNRRIDIIWVPEGATY